jgi:hypothetical protein
MFVECKICGKQMKNKISEFHLKNSHNITKEEYRIMFPGCEEGQYKCNNFECKICGEVMNGNSAIKRKHLIKKHNITPAEYNKEYNKQYCKCGCGELAEFNGFKYNVFKDGHQTSWHNGLSMENNTSLQQLSQSLKKYNKNNPCSDEKRKRKSEQSIKFWEEHPDIKKQMVESQKRTMQETHGVDNYFQTKEFQIQSKNTRELKYGDKNYNNRPKSEQTCLDLYGVKNVSQSTELQLKNVKNGLKFKEYKCKSGNIIKYQGYECYAFDILFETYKEEDIITHNFRQFPNIPDFWYFDLNNKRHIYYPDIFIIPENKFIEVKSTWTFLKSGITVKLKCECIKNAGYDIDVWIIENKKIKEIIKY